VGVGSVEGALTSIVGVGFRYIVALGSGVFVRVAEVCDTFVACGLVVLVGCGVFVGWGRGVLVGCVMVVACGCGVLVGCGALVACGLGVLVGCGVSVGRGVLVGCGLGVFVGGGGVAVGAGPEQRFATKFGSK
jgi:hypothetical protein